MTGGPFKAVVFDCDGVMFDTAAANRRYYNQVLAHFGRPELNDEQFVNVHMFTVREALAYLFPKPEMLERVLAHVRQINYHDLIPFMQEAPGLKSLLQALKDKGLLRAVATNRTDTMGAVLEAHGLKACFEMVVTAADVAHPKPAPEQLIKIMDALKLVPGEMLFVGDSEYDQRAARAAGVPFAAYENPALDADVHVTGMAELGRIVGVMS